MPCAHRFLHHHIKGSLFPDWDYDYLFIGTFNPGWTFTKGQTAAYFYGRTRNNYFWDLVPELWGGSKMRKKNAADWKEFVRKNRIGITDVITSIDDADENNERHRKMVFTKTDADLDRFNQIKWNTDDIIKSIRNGRKLKGIFVTNRKCPTKIETQFQRIGEAAKQSNINFTRLITPSSGARFSMRKGSPLYQTLLAEWKQEIDPLLSKVSS